MTAVHIYATGASVVFASEPSQAPAVYSALAATGPFGAAELIWREPHALLDQLAARGMSSPVHIVYGKQ